MKMLRQRVFQPLFVLVMAGLLASSIRAEEVTWIDVRTDGEFSAGHVPAAVNIEFEDIVRGVKELELDKDDAIYLYCGSGRRAGIAQQNLQEQGYTQVVNVGGLDDALARFEAKSPTVPATSENP